MRHAPLPSMLLLAVGLTACADAEPPPRTQPALPPSVVKLTSRSGKVVDFPCSQCHAQVDPAVVAGGASSKHRLTLGHGPLVCTTCHQADDMDRLRLPVGGQTDFDTPQVLCGQCHAARLADWRIGAHGKSIGGWAGERHRLVCTDCHNPHSPAIAPVTAQPGLPRPATGITKGAHR